jgi:hypothetical protein
MIPKCYKVWWIRIYQIIKQFFKLNLQKLSLSTFSRLVSHQNHIFLRSDFEKQKKDINKNANSSKFTKKKINLNLLIDTVLPFIESTTPNIKRFKQCIRSTSFLESLLKIINATWLIFRRMFNRFLNTRRMLYIIFWKLKK